MQRSVPCPNEFLASEIATTLRVLRELAAGASEALATLATAGVHEGDALRRLVIAIQAQDRVEQRLASLEAYSRRLGERGAEEGVSWTDLEETLRMDELIRAFHAHLGAAEAEIDTRPETAIELF